MSKTADLLKDYDRIGKGDVCEVCGHAGTNYCLRAKNGLTVICNRVESPIRRGEAGFLHQIKEDLQPIRRVHRPLPETDSSNTAPINWDWQAQVGANTLDQGDAERLGVNLESLRQLGAGRMLGGLRFPMRDGSGRVIGIRTRLWNGDKRAVTGSKNGLFIPQSILPENASGSRPPLMIVCEGPTSCAALLTMGLLAFGRAGNVHNVDYCREMFRIWNPIQKAVLADRDQPGSRGEEATQRGVRALRAAIPGLSVARPPVGFKDARTFLAGGGTKAAVECLYR